MSEKGFRLVRRRRRDNPSPIHMAVRQIWAERDPAASASGYYAYAETQMVARGYHVGHANDYTDKNWPVVHAWLQEHVGIDHYTWTGHLFYFESEEAAFQFRMFCQ